MRLFGSEEAAEEGGVSSWVLVVAPGLTSSPSGNGGSATFECWEVVELWELLSNDVTGRTCGDVCCCFCCSDDNAGGGIAAGYTLAEVARFVDQALIRSAGQIYNSKPPSRQGTAARRSRTTRASRAERLARAPESCSGVTTWMTWILSQRVGRVVAPGEVFRMYTPSSRGEM